MALALPYQFSHNMSDRHSFLIKWYRSIDPVILTCYMMLFFIGGILIASGGSAIARKINISSNFLSAQWWFFSKHIVFTILSITIMLGISFVDIKNMRRIGIIMFMITLPILFSTLIIGTEIKGSQRWVFGIQPSEFIKPSLIIFNAWLMSMPRHQIPISGILLSLISLSLTVCLLLLQPDLGQTILICATWIIMFFIAGGHILWFTAIGGISILGAITAYHNFSHVKMRIDSFLNPDAFDKYGINYQYNTAKSAFTSGGFLGRGPGEGEIKQILPDAHTDYIFAVAGEEFGVIFCWVIILL
jgi:cell division protein FtsW